MQQEEREGKSGEPQEIGFNFHLLFSVVQCAWVPQKPNPM